MNVLVRETGDTIAFIRKVVPGPADQSYGIEVAKLAGIPDDVTIRAREVLANLESTQYGVDSVPRLAGGEHGPLAGGPRQMSLFDAGPSRVEREICDLDVTTITPLEAFEKLVELKRLIENDE
jgi:DNA mismatch repair protein MutS